MMHLKNVFCNVTVFVFKRYHKFIQKAKNTILPLIKQMLLNVEQIKIRKLPERLTEQHFKTTVPCTDFSSAAEVQLLNTIILN